MNIQLVVAVDNQGALGKDKTMAWYIPQELRHFKSLTMGGVIVMGRVTFESIGRPLPGRISVVVSSRMAPDVLPPDTHWVASIEDALALAAAQYPEKPIWIGGGANVYAQMLPKAKRVHLSRIPLTVDGADAFFPTLDPTHWTLASSQDVLHESDARVLFTYQQYERNNA